MSLPLGFSPFDDYDSPYAATNAAIRSRQRQSNSHTPTSSFQQRRASHGSYTGVGAGNGAATPLNTAQSHGALAADKAYPQGDIPSRRPSPPPGVPAAEDFGSRRFSKSNAPAKPTPESPSGSSPGFRPIARPQPFGASLASFQSQATASPSSSDVSPVSPSPSVPSSPTQRRPAPPPPARAASPPASPSPKVAPATPKSTTARPPIPAPTSKPSSDARTSWTNKIFGAPRPAPAPAAARVPEPVAAPTQSEVDTLTPSRDTDEARTQDRSQVLASTAAAAAAPIEMTQTKTAPLALASRAPNSQTDVASGPQRHRQGAAAAAAAGLVATPAILRENSTERPAHTAFDMGDDGANDDSPFSEKSATPAAALPASAAVASGRGSSEPATQWKIGKSDNEGSSGRWGSNGRNASGAGAGAGAAGAGATAGLLGSSSSRRPVQRQHGLANSFRSNKKKWIIGGVIVLIIILVAAVVGGIVGSKSKGSSSDSGSGRSTGKNTGSSGSPSTTGAGGTKITPDPRLHNSFYGMNYEPFGTDSVAGCTANITAVMEDIKLLSQLTTRIRLSGSLCNETALVLDAITRTKVDLTVWAAITLNPDTATASTVPASWTNQVNQITFAFDTFGTKRVGGVSIGEEFVNNGGTVTTLLSYITRWRNVLSDKSSWGTLPVATAEVSSIWTQTMANAVDVIFANNQAWYSGIAAAQAAGWASGYLADTIAPLAQAAPNSPSVVMSEFGWPSAASSTSAATVDAAVASVASLQTVLDTFVCAANTNGTAYFFFEMFDFASTSRSDGVAPYWGLFDSSKNLKAITIPKCSHD
ncbi:unnamed protein product [Parajaminaea phylloscopi]